MAALNGPTSIKLRGRHGIGPKGEIQVIFGPMFSGKTTELIRRIKRYHIAKYTCVVIKYENDKRYDDNDVSTHDRQTYKAISATQLCHLKSRLEEFEVIGIDEGQFFPDVVEFCEDMARSRKLVIVAALDGDYQRKPFGDIVRLVPLAESVVKLNAVCMSCHEDGAFTKRICGGTQLEVIGGTDKYMAACRGCHEEAVNYVQDEKPIPKDNYNRKVLNSVENIPPISMENGFS